MDPSGPRVGSAGSTSRRTNRGPRVRAAWPARHPQTHGSRPGVPGYDARPPSQFPPPRQRSPQRRRRLSRCSSRSAARDGSADGRPSTRTPPGFGHCPQSGSLEQSGIDHRARWVVASATIAGARRNTLALRCGIVLACTSGDASTVVATDATTRSADGEDESGRVGVARLDERGRAGHERVGWRRHRLEGRERLSRWDPDLRVGI